MELKLVIEMEEKTRVCIEKLTEALTTGESVINISSSQIAEKIAEVVKKATKSKAKPKVEEPVMSPQDTAITDEVHKENEMPQAPVEAPTLQQPAEQPKQEVPVSATPTWTLEQLRQGCADASSLGKGANLKEIIRGKYGVIKLDELQTESYDSFVQDLRALGVRI
ncbi:MAG: hypothetical protein Q4B43_05570 [Bacteroidota bacterium]|nr:hypothetical protein [Bacteroidota bacterium]